MDAPPDQTDSPASNPSTSPCTCFRLRKLGRLLSQRYDAALSAAGINVNQFSILQRARPRPRTISLLAQELGMDRTTLSRDLRHLVAAGWISLDTGKDARHRLVNVTPEGLALLTRAKPLWRQAQDSTAMAFGKMKLSRLHGDLDQFIACLEAT